MVVLTLVKIKPQVHRQKVIFRKARLKAPAVGNQSCASEVTVSTFVRNQVHLAWLCAENILFLLYK